MRKPLRHGCCGLLFQPLYLRHVQSVGLSAAACDAKTPLADAREAKEPIGQLMEVDDFRDRADINSLGGTDFAALADQGNAEALVLPHAASHHVHVTRFKNTQR